MNCCQGNDNHNKNNHKGHGKGHMGHMLMMILCCGVPVILLLLLPLLSNVFPGSNGVLSRIIPFICPLMMIAMLPTMFRKDKGNTENSPYDNNKQLEETKQKEII